MRRCTIVFLVALLTMSISAAPVDVEQARSVALSFLKSNRPPDQILAYETDVSLVGWRSRYQIGCRFAGCYFLCV